MKRVRKWAIDPPPGEWQAWAGRARGREGGDRALFRRFLIRGLLRELEEKRGRSLPHSEATLDKLEVRLQGIALKYGESHWARKALTVKRNTIIDDVKIIRREKW